MSQEDRDRRNSYHTALRTRNDTRHPAWCKKHYQVPIFSNGGGVRPLTMNEQTAGSIVASTNGVFVGEAEEPPGTSAPVVLSLDEEPPSPWGAAVTPSPRTQQPQVGLPPKRRHPAWQDVPDELWEDWRWQRQHSIRTAAQLAELLPLAEDEQAALRRLESQYRTAIPPYYFSLIDVADPSDPIRLQSCPSASEEVNLSGVEFDDPLEEDKDSPVPGITHRYPDRALMITTPVCSMYCRFCTRKRVTMDRDGWDAPSRDEERMIEYIRDTHAIRDVILSGGDPLTLPVAKLRWFLTQLAAIDHLDVIRVGTRVPVTLPQRLFDPELVDLLASVSKVWIQTHFNHPVEITPEAARACRNLINGGMPINNHAVLMKGVNDSVDTMRELMRGLLRIKVRPYYLFHCDPVTGAGHFRTSVWKGIEIIEGLRGHMSGLGVPTYVVDGLHGAGKIPVMPNYLLSASDDAVVLRNYEGMIFRYAPEDKSSQARPVVSTGVSQVLSGGGKPLIPAESPRQARRRKSALERVETQVISADGRLGTVNAAVPAPSLSSSHAANGSSNGSGNGSSNGSGNGSSNGSSNGRANGRTNGRAAPSASPEQFPAKLATPVRRNGTPKPPALPRVANGRTRPAPNGASRRALAENLSPPIAPRSANGKTVVISATGRINGNRVTVEAEAAHFDVPPTKSELLRRPAKTATASANASTNGAKTTRKSSPQALSGS